MKYETTNSWNFKLQQQNTVHTWEDPLYAHHVENIPHLFWLMLFSFYDLALFICLCHSISIIKNLRDFLIENYYIIKYNKYEILSLKICHRHFRRAYINIIFINFKKAVGLSYVPLYHAVYSLYMELFYYL